MTEILNAPSAASTAEIKNALAALPTAGTSNVAVTDSFHANFSHAWSIISGNVAYGIGNLSLVSAVSGSLCSVSDFVVSKVTSGNKVSKAIVDTLLNFSFPFGTDYMGEWVTPSVISNCVQSAFASNFAMMRPGLLSVTVR